jgi:hypothetical protein
MEVWIGESQPFRERNFSVQKEVRLRKSKARRCAHKAGALPSKLTFKLDWQLLKFILLRS